MPTARAVWNSPQQTGVSVYVANTANITGTTLNETVWTSWNNVTTTTAASTIILDAQWNSWNHAYEETREEALARDLAETAWREADARRAREFREAKDRALELLGMVLSADQMASYREKGWFEVRGSKGRRWRIRANSVAGNVDLMPEIGEVREATLCCHPREQLPAPDVHLAQMLALVTDEDEFMRVANVHHRRAA